MKFPLVPFAVLCLAAGSYALVPSSPTPLAAPSTTIAESNFVSVSATGTFAVEPTYFSMKATISKTADLADECVMDFAQARTRAVSGIMGSALAWCGLDVIGAGVEFMYGAPLDKNMNNGGFIMSSNGQDTISEGVTLSEVLEVKFSPGADSDTQQAQVAAAIDIAVELGLKLRGGTNVPYYGYPVQNTGDGNATVSGKLSDEDSAVAQGGAQADAMWRARVLAMNLAELSGRQLGGIRSVRQSAASTSWKGIGGGVEATATLTIEFELL